MSESEPGYQPEEAEIENRPTLEQYIAKFGRETEEMLHTKSLLIEAIKAGNEQERLELHFEYHDQLEAYISSLESDAIYQILGDLIVARIYHEGGDIGRYLEELDSVYEYAYNYGFGELADLVNSEIESFQ